MKGFKRKICSALCWLSVLSSANKVESFSFRDICHYGAKVPNFFGYVIERFVSRLVFGPLSFSYAIKKDYQIIFDVKEKVTDGQGTLLQPVSFSKWIALVNILGAFSILNMCDSLYGWYDWYNGIENSVQNQDLKNKKATGPKDEKLGNEKELENGKKKGEKNERS